MNLATNFDWITPTVYILQDFWNRPVARFGIQANVGVDRGDIKRMMRKYGVRSWGYVYSVAGDMIMLSVPKAQAARANHALQSEGAPILYAPAEATGQPVKKRSVLGWLLRW